MFFFFLPKGDYKYKHIFLPVKATWQLVINKTRMDHITMR
jgi:hypothetical protein